MCAISRPQLFAVVVRTRFAWVKHSKAEGKMGDALKELSRLANVLSEEENGLKVKCLLKVSVADDGRGPLIPQLDFMTPQLRRVLKSS